MSSVYQRALVGGNWADYTPTLAGFAIGNGTIDSRFFRTGKLVFVDDRITFGSTSTFVGGSPTLTLPSDAASGSGGYVWFDGTAQETVSTGLWLVKWRSTGTNGTLSRRVSSSGELLALSSIAPFTWASGNILTRRGFYEEA